MYYVVKSVQKVIGSTEGQSGSDPSQGTSHVTDVPFVAHLQGIHLHFA